MIAKKYHAKILLFGEHAVLKGSDALAIPFPKFHGSWVYTRYPEMAEIHQMNLSQFADYLEQKSGSIPFFELDIPSFRKELFDGVYFQSNIPLGYGAGSSGALCAAIYDTYAKDKTRNPIQLKQIFSLMESYFHGSSSGFDPLISYLDQTIRISKGEMEVIETATKTHGLFLIDTNIKRNASEFIQIFMKKCEDADYEKNIREELVPTTTRAIASYLKNDITSLFHQMHDISRFQYLHFREMIPESMVGFWEKGLKGNIFKMKICGAGGGGFLLGMSKNMDKTKAIFKDIGLIPIT